MLGGGNGVPITANDTYATGDLDTPFSGEIVSDAVSPTGQWLHVTATVGSNSFGAQCWATGDGIG